MSEIQSSKYTDNNAAVIDIGSNSVRLVIYNGIGPASISVFNEKITCALAIILNQPVCLALMVLKWRIKPWHDLK